MENRQKIKEKIDARQADIQLIETAQKLGMKYDLCLHCPNYIKMNGCVISNPSVVLDCSINLKQWLDCETN